MPCGDKNHTRLDDAPWFSATFRNVWQTVLSNFLEWQIQISAWTVDWSVFFNHLTACVKKCPQTGIVYNLMICHDSPWLRHPFLPRFRQDFWAIFLITRCAACTCSCHISHVNSKIQYFTFHILNTRPSKCFDLLGFVSSCLALSWFIFGTVLYGEISAYNSL